MRPRRGRPSETGRCRAAWIGTRSAEQTKHAECFNPRRAKGALGSRENSRGLSLIDSEMAGQTGLKLGGMVEDMQENVLAKEFLGSVEVDRGQVSGPQVPLLGLGDD